MHSFAVNQEDNIYASGRVSVELSDEQIQDDALPNIGLWFGPHIFANTEGVIYGAEFVSMGRHITKAVSVHILVRPPIASWTISIDSNNNLTLRYEEATRVYYTWLYVW